MALQRWCHGERLPAGHLDGRIRRLRRHPEHLEKLLSSYQPKEVLVERTSRSLFDKVIGYRGFIFEVEDWSFAVENNRRKLTAHFGVQSLKGFGLEQRPASIAAAGAILNSSS